MPGVTWEEAKTGLATEGPTEEEWGHLEKRKRKVIADSDMRLFFGPYAKFTYGEVLSSHPVYVKFIIEGRGDNPKWRFTHWAAASMVDSFLKFEKELGEADESRSVERAKGGTSRTEISDRKERRQKELKPKPYVGPSLQRLLGGDPSALEEQRMGDEQSRMSK